nr:uncharacterized protein LOC112276775 [Physcomitrium patens]|eukprot:XP_024364217.1 uncharacterized protein LOC112276775 [Physcomitrella patens]
MEAGFQFGGREARHIWWPLPILPLSLPLLLLLHFLFLLFLVGLASHCLCHLRIYLSVVSSSNTRHPEHISVSVSKSPLKGPALPFITVTIPLLVAGSGDTDDRDTLSHRVCHELAMNDSIPLNKKLVVKLLEAFLLYASPWKLWVGLFTKIATWLE